MPERSGVLHLPLAGMVPEYDLPVRDGFANVEAVDQPDPVIERFLPQDPPGALDRELRRFAPHPSAGAAAATQSSLDLAGHEVEWQFDPPEIGRAHVEIQSLMRISHAVFC